MKANYIIVLLACVLLLGTCSGLFGQRTNAQITGVLTDATGAVVPDAEVVVTNEATGIKRSVTSNELGYYTVPLLPPGSYRIAVQK
jgi:hypothetical protein